MSQRIHRTAQHIQSTIIQSTEPRALSSDGKNTTRRFVMTCSNYSQAQPLHLCSIIVPFHPVKIMLLLNPIRVSMDRQDSTSPKVCAWNRQAHAQLWCRARGWSRGRRLSFLFVCNGFFIGNISINYLERKAIPAGTGAAQSHLPTAPSTSLFQA